MMDVLYLAWRYLAYHRFKTATLIAAITVIIYLPAGLNLLVRESGRQLMARAESTPVLIGAKGSPLELVLSSLYFESDVPPSMPFRQLARVDRSGLARGIPLHARFRTRGARIVGTSLDYFSWRRLSIDRGRQMGMLGECVVGAQAARRLRVAPGDALLSTPENAFELAGTYPLKMRVVGVLAASGTPDDRAVFVDVKTAWVMEGLAHGHQDLADPDAADRVLRRDGKTIIANPSVVQYNEITPENAASFHFHGDPAEFPVTSVIVLPHNSKSATLLAGRYLGDEELVQLVRPAAVMAELLTTIFTIQRFVLIAVLLIGMATAATLALVFALSLQLRRAEMDTMIKLGAARSRIACLIGAEILGVLLAGATIAAAMLALTHWLAEPATRWLVETV